MVLFDGVAMLKEIRFVAFALVLSSLPVGAQSLTSTAHTSTVPTLNARDAGARYAQAQGAAATCPGFRIGKAAETLRANYQGDDLKTFNDQSAKIYEAWLKVKNCSRPLDPNPCRIMIQMSCQSAAAEIGPGGTAVPDLLELNTQ
jgi:hypothetical protein